MNYTKLATAKTPASIIFLLDASASMGERIGGQRKIDFVFDALRATLRRFVALSTKGEIVSPRYRVALIPYSDEAEILLDGFRNIKQLIKTGIPKLGIKKSTDTAAAFILAEELLKSEIDRIGNFPAPVVCHLTDGRYTGADPTKVVERIKNLFVDDGKTLVQNIFISGDVLVEPIADPKNWNGVLSEDQLKDDYAKMLFRQSSVLPDSFRQTLQNEGFNIFQGARMMLPGNSSKLVSLGFTMAGSTPI